MNNSFKKNVTFRKRLNISDMFKKLIELVDFYNTQLEHITPAEKQDFKFNKHFARFEF